MTWKRILPAIAACACLALSACGRGGQEPLPSAPGKDIKIGVVLITDESDSGYSYNHMLGLNNAAKALGIPLGNITAVRNISESDGCRDAIRSLAEGGANIIFATSWGYEPYMLEVAKDYPHIQFCHASGYLAAGSGLANAHNYFPKIFEGRYLAGVAAGLKAKELGNPQLGYIAAFDNPEVVSGLTAFYLGAQSVYPNVAMDVIYTQSWGDSEVEAAVARELIGRGCGVISQHSDTNAPAVVCEEMGAFHVGYNSDMIADAPDASLVSARMDWGVYYEYALARAMNNELIDVDKSGGLADGTVYLSPLNAAVCAPGTDAAVLAARNRVVNGYHVFSGPLRGVNAAGEALDLPEGSFYDESGSQSAPTFDYIIDGITIVR